MYLDLFPQKNRGFIVNIFLNPIRSGILDPVKITLWVKNDMIRRKKYGPLSEHLQILDNSFFHPDLNNFIDYYVWYAGLSDEERKKQKQYKGAMAQRKKNFKKIFSDKRPLSWSAISAFMYSKDDFYSKYVLGIRQPPNPAMLFGSEIGKKIETDPSFMPEVPRYKHMEKKLFGKVADIELVGILDSFCPNTKCFYEYKTSSSKVRWTQKKAEQHQQLDFYYFLIWLNYQIPPEDIECKLIYIPVEETGDFSLKLSNEPIKIFPIRKTTTDILKFGAFIKQTYAEMLEYADGKEIKQ